MFGNSAYHIETTRLVLKPLSFEELRLYAQNDGVLEIQLGLMPGRRQISSELKEALEQTILPNVQAANREAYLFSTLWSVILKAEQVMVGDLCFMGLPNAQGEVEIGYGTYEAFQGRGFMTEALGGLLRWAELQSGIRAVIAKTEPTNTASFAVLKKNRFQRTAANEGFLHWEFRFQ